MAPVELPAIISVRLIIMRFDLQHFNKKVLLTGAGFSRNWGGRLAREMWVKIALKGTAAQCRFSIDVFVRHPGLSERPSSRL